MGAYSLRAPDAAPFRLRRACLFASTALSAALAFPAFAQTPIDPGTTPQGGVVVGGSSTITQAPGSTTINQSSQRTAIDWQSFNVGSNASVQFNQPSASAIALNRVTGGDLSQINGRIDANGQIVLINQSGVVFAKGSQVNAESIVVSTSNISNKDFMAGQMNFTGTPNPGAKIINEGHITAREAGLVGLVAPQVINSGVITAKLGQVVLAGGTAFTLDLYGDRLISLDVTRAVRAIDIGGKSLPALVTNSGIIIADGGHITLTAQDADSLVTQLINAGGTIQADSVGSQAGAISIEGVGGNIAIAGNLLARGATPGSAGGTVEALTTGTEEVASTAKIDVSGVSGGGLVALGTDIARARAGASDTTAPKAEAVIVASGASIKAGATGKGKGGTVTLLSKQRTDFDGGISVQGGPQGGDGGLTEISSDGVINLGGTVLATAINGQPGEILLDPQVLIVTLGGNATSTGTTTFGGTDNSTIASLVDPSQLNSLNGTVILEASSLVSVASNIEMTSASALSLVSLGDISITAGIVVSGSLVIDASNSLAVNGDVFAQNIVLNSGTSGTSIDALINAGTLLAANSSGGISEGSFVTGVGSLATTLTGAIEAPTLSSGGSIIGGNVGLTNANTIGVLGGFSVAAGHVLTLDDTGLLTVAGPVVAPTATLSADTIAITGRISAATALALESTGSITETGTIAAGTLTSGGTTIGGDALLTGTNTIANLGDFTVSNGQLNLNDTGLLTVAGNVTAPTATLSAATLAMPGNISSATALALESAGNITETGTIAAATLSSGGTSIGGNVALTGTNAISALGDFTVAAGHGFTLDDTGQLIIAGKLTAPTATLSAGSIFVAGSISASSLLALESTGNIIEGITSAITASTLTSGGTTIGGDVALTLNNTIATLAGFTVAAGHSFTLDDTGLLTIAGPLIAPVTTLSADTISIPGNISAATSLALESPGSITGAGTISTGILTSANTAIGGDLALTGTNSIAALGNVTAVGNIALNDTGSLAVSGFVSGANISLTAGTIGLANNLNAGVNGTVALNGGNVTQTLGTINAGTLTATGDNVLLNDLNTISALGNVSLSAGSTLSLDDANLLTVAGPVVAPTASLTAGTIVLAGNMTDTAGLALGASSITQNAGTITAGTLTSLGTIGGAALFADAGNHISNLGNFALGGTFDLNDAAPLTIIGAVTTPGEIDLSGNSVTEIAGSLNAAALSTGAGSFSGAVALSGTNTIGTLGGFLTGGDFTFADTEALNITGLVKSGGVLTLNDTGGGIAELTGGTLSAATLSGSIAGNAALTNVNTIASLNNFTLTAPNTLTLNDTGLLTIGDASAGIATIIAGSIDLAGTLSLSNLLDLQSASGIDQTSGLIQASELTGASTAGNVVLTQGNSISFLGGFTAGGNFDLVDNTPLFIFSPVSGANVDIAAPLITLSSQITAGSSLSPGTLQLASDQFNVFQFNTPPALLAPGGTIAIAPFTNGKNIDLGGFTAADLSLQQGFLSILDPTAADIIIGNAIGRQAGAINIDNSTSFGSQVLDLVPSGTITDNGTLTANTLAFSGAGFNQAATGELNISLLRGDSAITGPVALTSTLNNIAALGSLTITGADLAITDAAPLTVTGPAAAKDMTLIDTSSIGVNGNIASGNAGTINLVANTITSGGGSITAPGGTVAIAPYTNGTNIDLGGTAAGALDLSPALISLVSSTLLQIGAAVGHADGALTVDGPLTIAPLTLALSGTSITFNNSLTETGLLTVNSGGNITENAGAVIAAGTISGSGGTVDLGGANHITTLSNFAFGSNLTFGNAIPLLIAGLVTAPGTVALESSSNITETTGSINAGTLNSGGTSIGGDVALGNANTITALGGFTVANGHSLSLNDAAFLNINGPVVAPNTTLSAAGMSIAGNITAANILALQSSAAISESSGIINAGTLLSIGTISGNALFQNTNSIATLGNFAVSAGNAFDLHDSGILTVAGPLTAPSASLSAGSIVVAGSINVPNILTVASTNGINETTGNITAGQLTSGGAVIGGDAVLNNINNISSLGSFAAAGGLTLNDQTPLNIANNVSLGGMLALLGPGAITQTGGAITAAALTSDGGTIGGPVALTLPGNVIPVIGNFAAAGGLALADTGPVNLAGNISTGGTTLNLQTNGAITQTAGMITTGLLDARASEITLPDGNAIAVLGAVSTDNLLANGVSALTGPLAANNATIAAPGNLLLNGAARISGALFLTSPDNITQAAGSGPITASTASFRAGGAIDLSGTTQIASQLQLSAVGNITHDAGVLDAGTLTGNAGSLARFGASTDFGTIGSFFMQDSLFMLNNAGALTLAGPLKASQVSITAVGQVTLEGTPNGGLFITGGIEPSSVTTPGPNDSVITVKADANGNAQMRQTGTFYINAGPNAATYLGNKAPQATIFLSTTPNGDINFAPAPPTSDGLVGPTVDVILAAGPSGAIAGNVNLQRVVILSAAKVDLTGILDNIGGQAGAGKGFVNPFPQPGYRFNACPIGSVNCTILPIESLPAADPLQSFVIDQRKKRKLNHNVQLPGIATRDF